jgi:hypothetical protein
MLRLNFPIYNFKIKNNDNKSYIFDIVRKKYILNTAEEWVRQNVLNFLVSKGISKNHIAVEKKINIGKLTKRFDIVVFSSSGSVRLLIECKAPNIIVNQKVFDQTLIYNKNLNAEYMMVTNGLTHYFFSINSSTKTFNFIKEFPL